MNSNIICCERLGHGLERSWQAACTQVLLQVEYTFLTLGAAYAEDFIYPPSSAEDYNDDGLQGSQATMRMSPKP